MGKGDIADKGCHFALHLSTGQTEEQTVAGKSRQLGIGGHIRKAIDQIIAQQSVRAVVFPNLVQRQPVHSVAHGIAHRKTQHAAPIGG